MKKSTFIFLFFLPIFCGAQSYREWMKTAEEAEKNQNYGGAAFAWERIYEFDSANVTSTYHFAENLRKSWDYQKSLRLYEKVYKADRGREYPEALFWMAVVQKDIGDYKNARKNFRRALSKFRRKKESYPYLKINEELKNFEQLDARGKKDSAEATVRLVEKMQPGQIYGASVKDTVLIFSLPVFGDSLNRPKLFSAILPEDSGSAKNIFRIENSAELEQLILGTPAFSPKTRKVYFSVCERPSRCRIFVKDSLYAISSQDIGNEINLPGSSNSQPGLALINGKEYLFFVSDRDSANQNDIFYAILDDQGRPGKVLNAGDSVNTPGNEIAPFYFPADSTLYFSSDFHGGYGGFDIFSSKGEPGNFKNSYNLLPPFNTTSNDIHFIKTSKSKGYLVSNRGLDIEERDQWSCGNQLYQFSLKLEEEDTISIEDALTRLKKYIPLTLYFDNDEPDPRTLDTLTTKSYPETFEKYISRLDQYQQEYSKGLSDEQAEDAVIEITSFFDDYVNAGFRDLKQFTEILKEVMESGLDVELTIKGYASTLAKSDYNVNLARRRISSLRNYLKVAENGFFLPYFSDTSSVKLSIRELPFGEFKAAPDVSDNLNDLRNSVYSRRAALERKIEILAVDVTHAEGTDSISQTAVPGEKINETENIVVDFGEVEYGRIIEENVTIFNHGNRPLNILNAITSCGCTVAELPKEAITPGSSTEIKIRFDSRGKFGLVENTITLITDSSPEKILIETRANVKRP